MNDKYDPILEEQIKLALKGLDDLKRSAEERRYKKSWRNINDPFTLHEALSNFTKDELDEIRKRLAIKKASSLKKDALIAVLQEEIPKSLERTCLSWDTERYELLAKLAGNGGQLPAPDLESTQLSYFRETGLIYTGTYEKEKIVAVPQELIAPITAMTTNLQIRAAVKRNTEWIKLTHGLLYFYGTLTINEIITMLEKYMKEALNLRTYLDVINDANSYRKEVIIDKNGFSNIRVFDPERVIQEHRARSQVTFYPFTKEQVLAAGEPGYIERNQPYVQLVNFLTKNFEIDKGEADRYVEECVYATKIGENPNHLLSYLANLFEFDSLDTLQALMEKVVDLMNNTREWFLKGYTSNELHEVEKKHLLPLPTSPFNHSEAKKVVKIGRNDLCPCGSGKKYKKCCGRA